MTRQKRIQMERAYAEANLELLRMSANPSDMLFGRQARQGVRHALQALALAKGRDCQQDWSTRRLLIMANPGVDLSIGAGLLDQYPELGETRNPGAPNPLTQIPDHRFMITADIRMLLELLEQQPTRETPDR